MKVIGEIQASDMEWLSVENVWDVGENVVVQVEEMAAGHQEWKWLPAPFLAPSFPEGVVESVELLLLFRSCSICFLSVFLTISWSWA